MSEMPILIVPNQHAESWPDQLFISPVIEDFMDLDTKDGLKGIMRLDWEAFGKGNTNLPPAQGAVPQPVTTSGGSEMFAGYLQARNRLSKTFDSLQETDVKVKQEVENSDQLRAAAQEKVGDLIIALGERAALPPAEGITEDAHIMQYVDEGMAASEKLMTEASAEQEQPAGNVDELAAQVRELQAEVEKYKGLYEDLKNGAGNDDPSYDPDAIDPGQYDTDPDIPNVPVPDPIDTGIKDPTNPDGSTTDPSGVADNVRDAVDNLGDVGTGNGSTNTPAVPPAGEYGSAAGSSMMDSMLPMMMMQAMQRNAADSDLNGRREELDPSRYDQYPAAAVPAVAASPAVAQPATATPAVHANTAPPQASSTQPVSGPARTADADGSVVYTFPDGRTQKVSAIVAQALDAAFGNASGTDAQDAYKKTTAKWTDKKQIGAAVDPYQLMTGDVATWDNRSAVLVVFGSEEGGTLEAVVNGQLMPFTAEMSDSAGEFGTFSGFSHPNGIELAASEDKNTTPTVPGTGDAGAAMPVVAAPA